jgi:hypothetical protein
MEEPVVSAKNNAENNWEKMERDFLPMTGLW